MTTVMMKVRAPSSEHHHPPPSREMGDTLRGEQQGGATIFLGGNVCTPKFNREKWVTPSGAAAAAAAVVVAEEATTTRL